MKNLIRFLLLLILLVCPSQININAQNGWVIQNSNTSLDLFSIRFLNETTGWAVGDSGLILKTSDAGENWISSRVVSTALRALHFFDENTGVVVGGNYAIPPFISPTRIMIKTTNGGINWHIIMNSNDVPFRNIQFVNDSLGYIGVNGVLKTTNRGDTWDYYGGINSQYCFFMNENTGYATSGNGPTIYKTINGGINWSLIYNTGPYDFGGGVFFCNPNTGYAIGYSTIFKTTDAGISWQNKTAIDYYFRDAIYFSDSEHGVILTNTAWPNYYTIIQRTTNGGNSWQNTSTITRLNSVFFVNGNTGWILGNGGKILKTTTGGSTFVTQSSSSVPGDFVLHQNYPNPFNSNTNIKFEIKSPKYVNIKVYNMLGIELKTLVNEFLNPGAYYVKFHGDNNESGVYFYKIQTENYSNVKSMILLK